MHTDPHPSQGFGEAMRKLGQKLLKQAAPVSRAYQKHELVREHGERQAREWLARGLQAGGMKSSALSKVKGSDPRKVLLADLLWRRTVVSQEWLAEKLEMKSAANVSQQLRRLDVKEALKKVPEELKTFLAEADATRQ
ncbi:MAG: hypothetical protein K1X78_01025 [Verrucomicrobiaceae bacterium]|nr:hypothetical protein [Verrucomicrobiaceae bacterium]